MNHDEAVELLGVYALDAVEPEERAAVEAHLRDCARCRAEVADHREVASFLAHSGADAPDGVWQRIVGSLEEVPPGLRLVPAAPDAVSPPRRSGRPERVWRAVAGAVAAAAVVGAIVVTGELRTQGDRIDELETALEQPVTAAYQAALADPSSQIIELTSTDGTTALRGAVTTHGVAYLQAEGLPRLAEGRTYQLWGGAGDRLVSLGVLGGDPTVVMFPAHPYEVLAITEEDEPGVVASANPPVVQGGPS